MKKSDKNKFLIDGFPRQMDQALAFEQEVCKASKVLYFECPDQVMINRLMKRGETSVMSHDLLLGKSLR